MGKDLAGKISEKDDEEDSQAKDEKKPEAILDELDLFKMKLASKVKPNGKTSTVAKNNQKLLSTCLKKSGLAHTGEKALMQISVHSIMSSTPARQKAQKQK